MVGCTVDVGGRGIGRDCGVLQWSVEGRDRFRTSMLRVLSG